MSVTPRIFDYPTRGERLALALILLGGFALRITGVAFGISWADNWAGVWHPDEVTLVVGNLWPDMNPHYHFYPSFHIYLLFICNTLMFWTFKLLGFVAHLDYRTFIDFATTPALGAQFMLHRLVSVAFSMATLVLVYRAARAMWNAPVALVAALLLAVAPLHVQEAHYATVDAAFTFFALLTLYWSWRLYEHGHTRCYIAAALAFTATAAIKYNGMAAILAPLVAHVARQWREGNLPRGLVNRNLVKAGAVAFVLFWMVNPYILLDQAGWQAQFFGNIEKTGAFQPEAGLLAGYRDYWMKLMNGLGPITLVLGVFGGIALLIRPESRVLGAILLGFPAVFYLVMGSFETRNPRYLLPLYPVLCCTAAYLLVGVARAGSKARTLGAALALLAAFLTAGVSSQLHASTLARVRNIWTTDNRVLATEWINRNIAPGTRVLVERNAEYGPTLSGERYTLGKHDLRPGDDVERVADVFAGGWEYVVLSSFVYDLRTQGYERVAFYEEFRRDPRLVPIAAFTGNAWNDTFHNPSVTVYRVMASAPVAVKDPDGRYERPDGHMYVFEVVGDYPSDTVTEPRRSAVRLYEDGVPLGPAHAQHTDIVERGGGRFSHWHDGKIYFSASDNSDPNRNGRTYAFRVLDGGA